MRKLGLDLGSKSCGIAVSDFLGITAQGKENFRFNEYDWQTLINHLRQYTADIDVIVLGYPTLPSGDKSQTTLMVEEFAKILENEFTLPVVFVDESRTTKTAEEVMIAAGLSREKRKLHKDKLAAQIILQDYLNKF